MNISNKHYKEAQKIVENLNKEKNINDAMTRLQLVKLEQKSDGSIRELADSVGKLVGHLFFRSK